MLDIVLFAFASPPTNIPISPLTNEVRTYQIPLIDNNKNISASNCPTSSVSMGIQPKMISIAMSNIDGFTPNHLLQQVYGTQVLDEDLDLGLSYEELESVVGNGNVNRPCSDIFYQGNKIIDYDEFKQAQKKLNDEQQINYICNRLPHPIDKECCLNPQKRSCHERQRKDRTIASEIWQQIRDETAVFVKQAHNGFTVNLQSGKLTYRS